MYLASVMLQDIRGEPCLLDEVRNAFRLKRMKQFGGFPADLFAVYVADGDSVCCRAGNHDFVGFKEFIKGEDPLFKGDGESFADVQKMAARGSRQDEVVQRWCDEDSVF